RSGLGRPLPTIAVASMRVEDLDPSWQLGNGATLQAENLSNEAGTGPAAARLAIDAPNCGMRLLAEYAPHLGRPRWTMRIDARNLSVARQLSNTTRQQALALDGGQVSLTGLGWADGDGFEMPLLIHGRDLACHAMGQHKLAGIRGDHWATGLARLGDFKIQAVCRGSWAAPRFEVDPSLAAEQFRQQLHLGGQQELLAQIDLQANPTTGREAMPWLEPAASTEIATANPAVETTMAASQPSLPTPPQSTPAPTNSAPSTPAPSQVATAPTIEPTTNGPTSASAGTPSTAPLEVPAAIPAAPAAPATDVAAQSAGTTTAQAAQAPHDAPRNDMPVIEVGRPGPAFPAGTTVAPETTPVVAAVGTPLQGPGPVDLTVGYDQSTELWHPPAPPTEAIAVEPPRTPVSVPRANPQSGDAEFDEWNAEQEQLESRRERALAQLPANSDSLTSDETSTTVIELEPQEAKPSWFARMRGYFRRGKEPAAGGALEEQTPAHSFDPPEYIARGQRELPATGGTTKLR
ncbi:MAG: hypothetical protein JNG90_03140, partial [Planctomycetaceae bacterium]|nr:hypothetical protein [Planctomycetaceae bacterium]